MERSLEKRLEVLETRVEIENLMGTYCHYLFAGEGEKIIEELWSHEPNISIEIGASGRYIGRKKVASYYEKDHINGKFTLLLPVAPVIETVGEGLSAQGMWFILGMDTDAGELGGSGEITAERRLLFTSRTEDGKSYLAECTVQKAGVNFVREDGKWKICHFHQYDMLRFPCGSDWVRFAGQRFATDGIRLDAMFQSNLPFTEGEPPENLANAPTTYHWQYQTDNVTEYYPEIPKSHHK